MYSVRTASPMRMHACRSLLLRSQANVAEVRALHGLCKELEGRQLRQLQKQER
jgi:hypothetical protein